MGEISRFPILRCSGHGIVVIHSPPRTVVTSENENQWDCENQLGAFPDHHSWVCIGICLPGTGDRNFSKISLLSVVFTLF